MAAVNHHSGSMRGRRNVHDAIPRGGRGNWRARFRKLPRGAWVVWAAVLGVTLTTYFACYFASNGNRQELRRAQKALEDLRDLEEVRLSIPWFPFSMPESVEVTCYGLPELKGQVAEIHVEMSGTYDPRTYTARLTGRKEVLVPYTKLRLDWERSAAPGDGR